jgi:DinB superfamily
MRDSVARIRAVAGGWRPDQFSRSYAPGKWDARQILTHLAQSEIALGYRARMALTTPGYAAQPFDQDAWMNIEAGGAVGADVAGQPGSPAEARSAKVGGLTGHDALDAFVGTAVLNIALFASLSDRDRAITLSHPEYGALTVDWIIHQMAGHQIHHLKQLEAIAGP